MTDLAAWLKAEQERTGKGEGHWLYSYRFAELKVARESGLFPPSRWDGLSMPDKEEAFAFWLAEKQMANWESYLQEQRLEKAQQKGNKKR